MINKFITGAIISLILITSTSINNKRLPKMNPVIEYEIYTFINALIDQWIASPDSLNVNSEFNTYEIKTVMIKPIVLAMR